MNTRDRLTTSSPPSGSLLDGWATALVHHAARRAPGELSARLEEEWLADLAEHSGALARLRFALGCCWARRVISHDPVAFGVSPQRAPAGASVALAGFVPPSAAPFSRRTLVLSLIVALHVVGIYAFSNGLGHGFIAAIEPNFDGDVINIDRVLDPPPPMPLPKPEGVVRPDPDISQLVEGSIGPITITEEPPVPSGSVSQPEPPRPRPEPARAIKHVAGGPGAGFPGTEEFYPSLSRQLGEKGAAAVQVCVDTHGRLTGAPEIGESSGMARLDAAALALARAGSGHYRSSTDDGKPVPGCFGFRVRFELR